MDEPFTKVFSPNLVDAFRETSGACIRATRLPNGCRTCIRTTDGDALLTGGPLPVGGTLWVFGFPLCREPGNPVYHPAFPLLAAGVLGGETTGEGMPANVYAGETVNVTNWFQCPPGPGNIVYPGASTSRVTATSGRPQWLSLETPGFYRLSRGPTNIVRAVNVRSRYDEAKAASGQPAAGNPWPFSDAGTSNRYAMRDAAAFPAGAFPTNLPHFGQWPSSTNGTARSSTP